MIVWKSRKQLRREAEAERQAKLRAWQIETLLEEKRRAEVLAETGVDLLAGTEFSDQQSPRVPSADVGAGWQDGDQLPDTRSSSESLSDHIRDVLHDPDRRAERQRLKAGGSHDAKDVPEDAPGAVSYPRVPWEDR